MTLLLQQIVEGLAIGAVYASLALAITLIHRSTKVANFAQGEMAMFSTYIAWQLTVWGVPIILAIPLTMAAAFVMGMAIEGIIIRRIENADLLTIVIVTFSIFLLLHHSAGLIWGHVTKSIASPFPTMQVGLGPVRISAQSVGTVFTLALEVVALWFIFQKTKIGLAMRAVTQNKESAALSGINPTAIYQFGWGLAAVLGALAGALVAPRLYIEPNIMGPVLIFAFAACALGGIDSPLGAVVGSLIVGVTETLASTFIPFLGADMKIVVPFGIIVLTLLVKPEGIFGNKSGARV